MIGFTVIGGFLGSGKTTLINAILATATERMAVVVNDLGEINVDAALVSSATEEAIELTNGCVCCSIGSSFAATLKDICTGPNPPQRVVVECSGAAEPARVAAYGNRKVLDPATVIVVADATDIRRRAEDRRFADLVLAQLTSADLVAISKTDLVAAGEVEATERWLRDRVDVPLVRGVPTDVGAVVPLSGWTTVGDAVPLTSATRSVPVEPGTSMADVEALLLEVDGLVRAKGVVASDEGSLLVQWAAGRLDVTNWSGPELPSALVLITA